MNFWPGVIARTLAWLVLASWVIGHYHLAGWPALVPLAVAVGYVWFRIRQRRSS